MVQVLDPGTANNSSNWSSRKFANKFRCRPVFSERSARFANGRIGPRRLSGKQHQLLINPRVYFGMYFGAFSNAPSA